MTRAFLLAIAAFIVAPMPQAESRCALLTTGD